MASAGAGSDCEQMLAILNPLFNSLRQLFPIPKVGRIRIKFIPELNTHIYTHTPHHHLEAKLVSILGKLCLEPGTRLCFRLTPHLAAPRLPAGPAAWRPTDSDAYTCPGLCH